MENMLLERGRNKDKEFWRGLEKWDVMVLTETWMEEKGWDRVKAKLPKGYKWEKQWANKRNRKGRAMGGIVMGIRKEIVEEQIEAGCKEEGIIEKIVKIEGIKWRIVGVYVNEDLDRKLECLRGWMEEKEENIRVIIGGDFNARTGEEGGSIGIEEEETGRRSKDKKVNTGGRRLLDKIEEIGWTILNGNVEGDEEGEFTYTEARGQTVIDYVLGDEETREMVEGMEIGDEVDSDHHRVVVKIKRRGRRERRGRADEGSIGRGDWSESGRENFKERMERIEVVEGDVNRELRRMTEKILEVIKEEQGGTRRGRWRGWWDEECAEKKRDVRWELRRWRRGGGDGQLYRERKKEYREICDRKKEIENEKLEKEAREARNENKVWEIVNRKKGVEECKRRNIRRRVEGIFYASIGGCGDKGGVGRERDKGSG